MALNILSTGVMVRLGKVFGNRMVDVSVSNAKLEDRALRILGDLAGVGRNEGASLLAASGGSVKLALLLAASDLSVEAARKQLNQSGGNLRLALENSAAQLKGPQ